MENKSSMQSTSERHQGRFSGTEGTATTDGRNACRRYICSCLSAEKGHRLAWQEVPDNALSRSLIISPTSSMPTDNLMQPSIQLPHLNHNLMIPCCAIRDRSLLPARLDFSRSVSRSRNKRVLSGQRRGPFPGP